MNDETTVQEAQDNVMIKLQGMNLPATLRFYLAVGIIRLGFVIAPMSLTGVINNE